MLMVLKDLMKLINKPTKSYLENKEHFQFDHMFFPHKPTQS